MRRSVVGERFAELAKSQAQTAVLQQQALDRENDRQLEIMNLAQDLQLEADKRIADAEEKLKSAYSTEFARMQQQFL